MYAVKQVVAVHYRAYLAFGDGLLERGEVYFKQRSLVNFRAYMVSAPLLVVAGEVLNGSQHAARLHSVDVGQGGFTRQVRVFAKVFIVPSAQRRTVDVHSGAEQYAHASRPRVVAKRASEAVEQIPVPRGRAQHRGRIQRAVGRMVAYSHRTVGQQHRRNADSRYFTERERRRARQVAYFLFEGHLGYDVRRPLLNLGCHGLRLGSYGGHGDRPGD